MSGRVLLIGLDGATFTVLDRLMADGGMPFLKEFTAAGARSTLRSVIPALTPPAWTSLMTGRSPGHHGVFDFFRMDSPETRHISFATSHDVGVETIWTLASNQRLKVTALNFPLMFPPPRVSGYVVPGWIPWRQLRLACWPAGLFDRLKQLPGFDAKELAMDIKLEERATEGCDEADYEPWVQLHTRRERNWYEVMRFLMREDPCELTGVVFDGVDKLQHLCWRFIEAPQGAFSDEGERRIQQACRDYFRQLDDILRGLCDEAGPQTTVVIASDHGFGATEDVFHVNAWLERQGYLAWSQDAERSGGNTLLGVGLVARHTFQIDWQRTRAFTTTPTSNGIYIVSDQHGPAGVPAAQYNEFRTRLIGELRDVRDPATGEPIVSEVWTREEAFGGPAMASAPDLTLVLRDGGLVSILPSADVISRRPTRAGAHRPDGIFAARGPGIRAGAALDELSILDVAPLVLHGLGLEVPSDLEGRVPVPIFEAAHLAGHPVRVGAASGPMRPVAEPEQAMGPDEEAAVLQRLRQLGYIE